MGTSEEVDVHLERKVYESVREKDFSLIYDQQVHNIHSLKMLVEEEWFDLDDFR